MSRPAKFLVELLVVLLLIAVCLALLLPVLRKVREASARTQTNDNIKQLALAVHAFHDQHRKFPSAYGAGPNFENEPVSIWFHILPYLQAEDVYKARSLDAIVPAFQAPSDPSEGDRGGMISMAGNIRVFGFQTLGGSACNAVNHPINLPRGTLICGLTMGRLTSMDGTSNILMLVTRRSHCSGRETWYAADAHGFHNGAMGPPAIGAFAGAGAMTDPPTRLRSTTAIFQTQPKEDECVPDAGLYGHSFGAGGLSAALCDGSVKNMAPAMSPFTFAKAMSPGDGFDWNRGWAED